MQGLGLEVGKGRALRLHDLQDLEEKGALPQRINRSTLRLGQPPSLTLFQLDVF